MGTPQRYPDGLTNIGKGKTLSEMPMTDPTKVHGYFTDFLKYTPADWVVSDSGTGTAVVSDTLRGGALVVSIAGTAGTEFDFFQLSNDHTESGDSEVFYFATGKKAWFKTRFQGKEIGQSEIMAGLYIENTDPRAAAPTDGVWFETDDGTDDIDLIIAKNSSQVKVSGVCTMTDDTYVTLGYYWDGVDRIHYFVDDVEKGYVYVGTSLPDDEYLALSFGIETGQASAANSETLSIDYIGAWMER